MNRVNCCLLIIALVLALGMLLSIGLMLYPVLEPSIPGLTALVRARVEELVLSLTSNQTMLLVIIGLIVVIVLIVMTLIFRNDKKPDHWMNDPYWKTHNVKDKRSTEEKFGEQSERNRWDQR